MVHNATKKEKEDFFFVINCLYNRILRLDGAAALSIPPLFINLRYMHF